MIEAIFSGIQNFFNWLINSLLGFFGFFGDAAQAIVTAITNVFIIAADIARIIGEFITFIINVINELVAIAVLIVRIILAFFALLFGWLFQIVAIFFNFISTFFSSTPTPLPGWPECITDPTSHDICAIWYITDNTVFSNGPGEIIVTLLIICIDIAVVWLLIYAVFKFLRIGDKINA